MWFNLLALSFCLGSFAVGRSAIGAWMAGMGLGIALVLCVQDLHLRRVRSPRRGSARLFK